MLAHNPDDRLSRAGVVDQVVPNEGVDREVPSCPVVPTSRAVYERDLAAMLAAPHSGFRTSEPERLRADRKGDNGPIYANGKERFTRQ